MRMVCQNDIALDRRQTIGQRLHERHEGKVDQRHPVFGVVDDPGDLLGEEARVDGVIDRARPGYAVPAFEVPVAIPGERRDAVAVLDLLAMKPLGDFQRAMADIAIVRIVHRPFDRAGRHFPFGKLDGGEVDDLVHEQGPILHPSMHPSLPKVLTALDCGARIGHGTYIGALCGSLQRGASRALQRL